MLIFILYLFLLILITAFSYGFIDANSPFKTAASLYNLIYFHRGGTTIIYSLIIVLLFSFYFRFLSLVKKKKLTAKDIWRLIAITAIILFFAFPGFSHDVFNYIATARVTFLHRENPYIVMPIEIPNEPMLGFMHAANKTALYGPVWILLTALPHFAGLGHLFLSIFAFKALVILFYFSLSWLIWKLSNENLWSLVFFALNPLVVIETLVGGHNDVVMMTLALLAFYFLKKKKVFLTLISLFLSIMIKFATAFLLPVFVYIVWQSYRHKEIIWEKIWLWSFYSMLAIFLLSPLREEIYSWYFIWPLSFVALLPEFQSMILVSLAFSFGLLFRIAPFLYTRSWSGQTPTIKKIVTFLPPIICLFYLRLKKCLKRS